MAKVIWFVVGNDVPCIISMEHRHVIRTNFGIAPNNNITISTANLFFRNAIYDMISAHRSQLATAIDTLSDLGIAPNGDRTITTYQCRVAMCP